MNIPNLLASWFSASGILIQALTMLLFGGCLMGCAGDKRTVWDAEVTGGETSTQFEIAWGSSIKIGFPGHFSYGGKASGDVTSQPKPTPAGPP